MKKFIWLTLCVCIIFALCGCEFEDNHFNAVAADFDSPVNEKHDFAQADTEEDTTEDMQEKTPPKLEEPEKKKKESKSDETKEGKSDKKKKDGKGKDKKDKKKPGKKKDKKDNPVNEDDTKVTTEAKEDPTVISITYDGSFQDHYYTGDAAVFSKSEVEVTYSDGTKKKVPFSECSVSGFDTGSPGSRKVTIAYKGASVALDYTVEDGSVVTALTVSGSIPVIPKGGSLDTSAISVTATTVSGKTETISVGSCEISGFDSSSTGNKSLTVSYGGQSGTISYTVKTFSIRYEYVYETYVDGSLTSAVRSGSKMKEVTRKSFSDNYDIIATLGLDSQGADSVMVTSDSGGGSQIGLPLTISDSSPTVTIYIFFRTHN